MKRTHQDIGRESKRSGIEFEKLILKSAKDLEQEQVLVLRKTDPPVNVVRRGSRVTVIPRKGQFLDFIGVEGNGRAVFIEAKSTADDRLPLRTNRGLKEHQWQALRLWHWGGAHVGVIWKHRSGFSWVSYTSLRDAIKLGKKSITPQDCCEIKLAEGRLILEEYIGAIRY